MFNLDRNLLSQSNLQDKITLAQLVVCVTPDLPLSSKFPFIWGLRTLRHSGDLCIFTNLQILVFARWMNQQTLKLRTDLQRSVQGDRELHARAISAGPRSTSAMNLIHVHIAIVSI
jgi:hypothetical protein